MPSPTVAPSRRPRRARSACAPARAAWITLFAAVAAAFLQAQSSTPQKPPQEQRPPAFRSDANFVRVDAYPTAGGRPVLDLRAQDFEVFEDGVAQSIESFERVIVRPAGPQAERTEPNTIEASRQLAANPRNRVFVLFLDVPHVTMHGAWTIREPLLRLVDRILGEDDLVGVMTPAMSADQLVLARKTDVLTGGLRDRWPWGERHTLARDERERLYELCYGSGGTNTVVQELIARRRERMSLDALNGLVRHLGGIREDRKAIVTITEGWLLFKPNRDLTRLRVVDPATGATEPVPGRPPIGVGPDGRLGMENRRYGTGISQSDCDVDRMQLAEIDDERYLRDIIDTANRANASFYTIDPRGLAAADAPIGPEPPPPPYVDLQNLRDRHDAMHELAGNTDGMAVMGSNDLDKGLKRIADDLTSYYLLGYYSTNTTLDGRFRSLSVRVKRPGVDVRARRGYRAATEAEVTAARAAAAAPAPGPAAAVTAAMTALARLRPESVFQVHAAPGPAAGGGASLVWIAGQISAPRPGESPRQGAGVVDIQVTGGASGSAQVTLDAGQRAFMTAVPLDKPAAKGSLDIRARLTGLTVVPFTDTISLPLDAAPRAMVFRRGPVTGNRPEPAGAMQFSRTERIRLEIPAAAGAAPGAGRVLDRNAQPLNVPVTVGERTDAATGQRWITADVTLAPLTLGDYAIEVGIAGGPTDERILTAIRIGR